MSNENPNTPDAPEGPANVPTPPEYRDPALPVPSPGSGLLADQMGPTSAHVAPDVEADSAFGGPPREPGDGKVLGIVSVVLGVIAVLGTFVGFLAAIVILLITVTVTGIVLGAIASRRSAGRLWGTIGWVLNAVTLVIALVALGTLLSRVLAG